MYKVFIVDDEELVVKSLIASIRWEDYGFLVEGYALSGYDAYEQIQILKPDIVFTDIRMPGMSGLELIKNLKEQSCESIFIVVSGYAEFAYAQKAIRYGAFGYCLKPFDEGEISGYLIKAIQLLKVNKIDEMALIELIEEDSVVSRSQLALILESHRIAFSPQKSGYLVMSIGKSKLELPRSVCYMNFKIGVDKYIYFIMNKSLETLLSDLREMPNEGIKGIGISNVITRTDEIKITINQIEMRAYHFFTSNDEERIFQRDTQVNNTNDYIQRLDAAIGRNDIHETRNLLDESLPYFLSQQFNIKHALIIYNHIISFLSLKGQRLYEEYMDSYDNLVKTFTHVQEMIAQLKVLLVDRVRDDLGIALQPTNNRTVMELLRFVDENFCSDISVDSISKEFYMNGPYIGQLFKKELGITFTEYLTQSRMNYALSLIEKTELGLSVIAEKVGYKDYFYFSRIFKKIHGQAPSYYRDH